MEGEGSVTRSIIDELLSRDVQGDQLEGESGDAGSLIDDLILARSKEMKWKLKGMLLEVSLMNLILRISK